MVDLQKKCLNFYQNNYSEMKNINDLDFIVPEEIKRYTNHSREISIKIIDYMESNGLNELQFSEIVEKDPNDIEKWISGSHNFTILTLSLIEVKTGMELIKGSF